VRKSTWTRPDLARMSSGQGASSSRATAFAMDRPETATAFWLCTNWPKKSSTGTGLWRFHSKKICSYFGGNYGKRWRFVVLRMDLRLRKSRMPRCRPALFSIRRLLKHVNDFWYQFTLCFRYGRHDLLLGRLSAPERGGFSGVLLLIFVVYVMWCWLLMCVIFKKY